MPRPDRERLLDLVEGLRAEMNLRLDALAAAIRGEGEGAPEAPSKAPSKRRAPLRPPLGETVLLTDDVARAKARQALERMGLAKVRG